MIPLQEKDATTIEEFCALTSTSRASYFKGRRAGRGPRELRDGKKVLITREARLDWLREREAASACSRSAA